MGYSQIIDQLGAAYKLKQEFKELVLIYRELFPSGVHTYQEPITGGLRTYEPERWAQKRIAIEEKLKEAKQQLIDAEKERDRLIRRANKDDWPILIDRYKHNMNWTEIGKRHKHHRTTAMRKHDRAIGQISRGV
jgi:hypothetical protein